MLQNLADLNLTADEMASLNGALDTIQTILGSRGVSLTVDERQSLVKMGPGTRPFCEQAVAALQANAGSLPPDFDVSGLVQDLADYIHLEGFLAAYDQQRELLEDTLKALASDIMTNSIVGVTVLKVLNKLNPALDNLLRSLREVRRRRPAPKTAVPVPAPVPPPSLN